MKTYEIKGRLVHNAEANIIATFKGGLVYRGTLANLRQWVVDNKANAVLNCIVEGKKHGLYPCIVADTDSIRAGLSALLGVSIVEGWSFPTRMACREWGKKLVTAGISIPPTSMQWMISELPYDTTIDGKPRQLTLDEQLDDRPF